MTLPSVAASHLLTRAAASYALGSRHIWVTCLCAARIVGRYDVGATLKLADAIQRSPDTVGNYATAGKLLLFFRRELPRHYRSVRQVRNRLSYLHFCRVYRALKREEFSPRLALLYLIQAMRQKLSPERLDTLIDADYPAPRVRADVLPVFGIGDDQIERLRAEMPGAFVLILPGLDGWQAGDHARVVKVRKS